MVNRAACRDIAALVDDAVSKGAKVLTGGGPQDRTGFFFAPTILTDVPADADILKEEVFGPVAPITAFDDTDDAVAKANDTEYGLISYVYTRDLAKGLSVAERMESGMVGLNRPGSALRQRQAIGHRPRRRPRRHAGVPREEVHRDELVAAERQAEEGRSRR